MFLDKRHEKFRQELKNIEGCYYCRKTNGKLIDTNLDGGEGVFGNSISYPITAHRFCRFMKDTFPKSLFLVGILGGMALAMMGTTKILSIIGLSLLVGTIPFAIAHSIWLKRI